MVSPDGNGQAQVGTSRNIQRQNHHLGRLPYLSRHGPSNTGRIVISSRNGGLQRQSRSPKKADHTISPGPSKAGIFAASSPCSTKGRRSAPHGNGTTNPSTQRGSHYSSTRCQMGAQNSLFSTRATRRTRRRRRQRMNMLRAGLSFLGSCRNKAPNHEPTGFDIGVTGSLPATTVNDYDLLAYEAEPAIPIVFHAKRKP